MFGDEVTGPIMRIDLIVSVCSGSAPCTDASIVRVEVHLYFNMFLRCLDSVHTTIDMFA